MLHLAQSLVNNNIGLARYHCPKSGQFLVKNLFQRLCYSVFVDVGTVFEIFHKIDNNLVKHEGLAVRTVNRSDTEQGGIRNFEGVGLSTKHFVVLEIFYKMDNNLVKHEGLAVRTVNRSDTEQWGIRNFEGIGLSTKHFVVLEIFYKMDNNFGTS